MENTTFMNWRSFKETLQTNPDLTLQFQYAPDKMVEASYHITEIKQSQITSVDCGGKLDAWTEVIVQLWEPSSSESEQAMKVTKAMSIINLVEKALPLDPLAVVKIEFGNSEFDTRQMYPGELEIDGENLIVILNPDRTQCKATGRGQTCGTPAVKTKVELKNLAVNNSCCTPASGCC
ncbi:DUF6428 family protein [Mucilaginibacter sp. dw_454]|uniref:DUF6428 family protein n=1 Tax=Mucilaginibacter sp. dw_454 TaxID=2720079 RepID=UPI001BD43B75|nr:DUF6428 family protein [Mucilaginibacter sp. dw_454]